MPYQDFAMSSQSIELPRGSTLEQTDAAAKRVAQLLQARPEVESVMTTAGSELLLSDAAGGPKRARVVARLVSPMARKLSERDFANVLLPELSRLPDMRVRFDNASGKKDISIALVGADPVALTHLAEQVERSMRALPGLSGVGASSGQRQPEVVVVMGW